MRFKAWHFINCKPIVSYLIAVFKKVLKPKLIERVSNANKQKNINFFFQIHCDLGTDSLKKYLLDADIPKDYGGKGPSLQELQGEYNILPLTDTE